MRYRNEKERRKLFYININIINYEDFGYTKIFSMIYSIITSTNI